MGFILWRIFSTGLFFAPLFGGEGRFGSILAWVLILCSGTLQYRMAAKGKWKWVCPAMIAAVLCITGISIHLMDDWGALALLLCFLYQLYILTGILLGWAARTLTVRIQRNRI